MKRMFDSTVAVFRLTFFRNIALLYDCNAIIPEVLNITTTRKQTMKGF